MSNSFFFAPFSYSKTPSFSRCCLNVGKKRLRVSIWDNAEVLLMSNLRNVPKVTRETFQHFLSSRETLQKVPRSTYA